MYLHGAASLQNAPHPIKLANVRFLNLNNRGREGIIHTDYEQADEIGGRQRRFHVASSGRDNPSPAKSRGAWGTFFIFWVHFNNDLHFYPGHGGAPPLRHANCF